MKTIMSCAALAAALCVSGCETLPTVSTTIGKINLGEMQGMVGKVQKAVDSQRELTLTEEVTLGEGIASNILGAAPLWNDARAQRYVGQVGQWLAAQTERPDLKWHFAVLDDADVNAFAAPGGYIFITRAMLQGLHSEAELAGVLAHEIAHVLKRHHLQAIKLSAGRAALADLGTAVVAQTSSAARAAMTPGMVKLIATGTEIFTRGLDKGDEFEADRMAVVIAARAGYDPYGLPAVLQSLQTVNPDHAALALLFKTHPSFSSRLDALAGSMGAQFDQFENQPALAPRFKAQVAALKPLK
jgi:predicted Zn-dependent protease